MSDLVILDISIVAGACQPHHDQRSQQLSLSKQQMPLASPIRNTEKTYILTSNGSPLPAAHHPCLGSVQISLVCSACTETSGMAGYEKQNIGEPQRLQAN
ncbi:hypothetical protein GX50_00052 [[Emmonsia] crescens]|uniref:Uncharacterized protein n=1 Tax=[Emmonsia] crescens TaxID=73230 RepID=A0A2B7ZV38_9EURO|nr:hypothetical protein GX50_00052 [Emmonsia crescens]